MKEMLGFYSNQSQGFWMYKMWIAKVLKKPINKDHLDIKIEEDLQCIVCKIHSDNRLTVNQYMPCTTSYKTNG